MNKTGKSNVMAIVLIALAVFLLWPQISTMFAGGQATVSGGQPQVIQVQNVNPSDTVTFTVVAKQKQMVEQGINTTYEAVTAYAILGGMNFKSSQVEASSAGGSLSGLPVGKTVDIILENTTNLYTEKIASVATDSGKPIDAKVTEFSALKVRVYNHTDATYAAASANSVNLSGMALTAGGSSQKYTFYGEVTDSYTTFGQDGIYVGCTGLKASTYVVGTDMSELSTSTFGIVADEDKDRLWKSKVTSVSSDTGSVAMGYLDIKLKGGETAPAAGINCTFYDSGNYLSIDGFTVKSGINKDDTLSTDVGGTNAYAQWEP